MLCEKASVQFLLYYPFPCSGISYSGVFTGYSRKILNKKFGIFVRTFRKYSYFYLMQNVKFLAKCLHREILSRKLKMHLRSFKDIMGTPINMGCLSSDFSCWMCCHLIFYFMCLRLLYLSSFGIAATSWNVLVPFILWLYKISREAVYQYDMCSLIFPYYLDISFFHFQSK